MEHGFEGLWQSKKQGGASPWLYLHSSQGFRALCKALVLSYEKSSQLSELPTAHTKSVQKPTVQPAVQTTGPSIQESIVFFYHIFWHVPQASAESETEVRIQLKVELTTWQFYHPWAWK